MSEDSTSEDSAGHRRCSSGDASAASSADAGTAWKRPLPLGRLPVPPFPIDVLPAWLQTWVSAQSESVQTPTDLAGMLSLGAIAACAAKRFAVCVRPSWLEPVNIFVVVALPSGEGKSPILSAVARPIYAFQARMAQEFGPLVGELRTQRAILEKRRRRLINEAARAGHLSTAAEEASSIAHLLHRMPHGEAPRLLAEDVTLERLPSIMAGNGGRIAVLSAEGTALAIMAGRYGGRRPSIEVVLQAYSGEPISVDRADKTSVQIESPALTLGIATQPESLRMLGTGRDLRGRGLLARMLFAVPESRVGYRTIGQSSVPTSITEEYARRLTALLSDLYLGPSFEAPPPPQILTFSSHGDELLTGFRAELEKEMRPSGSLAELVDWGSKLPGAVARLAGLLAIGDAAGSRPLKEVSVTPGHVERGISLARYLIPHARAAFALMGGDTVADDAEHILGWIRSHDLQQVSRRDLQRNLNRFRSAAELDAPLNLLEAHRHLRRLPQEPRVSGRPRGTTYEVNPLWDTELGKVADNTDATCPAAAIPSPGEFCR